LRTPVWAITSGPPQRSARAAGGPKPAPPQGQHPGMEALVGQGQPTGDLPSEVPPKLDGRLPVRQPRQRLHHHDRGHLVGRNQRPTTTRGEQVSEQLLREQVPAMSAKKPYTEPSSTRWRHSAAASSSSTRLGSVSLACGQSPAPLTHIVGPGKLFAQQAPRRGAAAPEPIMATRQPERPGRQSARRPPISQAADRP
jgi:hypothetical protein